MTQENPTKRLPPGSDGLPLVGPVAGLPGLILAVGHHRNGILLGPLTGVLVKQWLVDHVQWVPGQPASLFSPVGGSKADLLPFA